MAWTPATGIGISLSAGGGSRRSTRLALAPTATSSPPTAGTGISSKYALRLPGGRAQVDPAGEGGDLFGLAIAPFGRGVLFVDDGDNTLKLFGPSYAHDRRHLAGGAPGSSLAHPVWSFSCNRPSSPPPISVFSLRPGRRCPHASDRVTPWRAVSSSMCTMIQPSYRSRNPVSLALRHRGGDTGRPVSPLRPLSVEGDDGLDGVIAPMANSAELSPSASIARCLRRQTSHGISPA